jgi:hypothetical protein
LIAIRRSAGAPVELLPDYRARVLLEQGAIPANGHVDEADEVGIPHIDERVEVLGLTDRDPEFFENQAAQEGAAAVERAFPGPPADRMHRGSRRKGR